MDENAELFLDLLKKILAEIKKTNRRLSNIEDLLAAQAVDEEDEEDEVEEDRYKTL